MIGAGLLVGLSWPFYPMMILAGLHLVWQITTVEIDDPDRCLMIFRSNRWFGWLVLAAILLGKSG
jgi:4-hydroxybenzoate polyprenyltransferase